MLVMISCGPKSSSIIKTISTQTDNIDFQCYYSIDEFINQSTLRHLAFDRLVFTSKFINNDEDMSKLCDYIRSNMSMTEVVMILPKSQQSLEEVFKKYFDSPMYTVMYIDRVATKNIVDAVSSPIVDIRAKYYTFDKPSSNTKKNKIGTMQGGKRNKTQNQENDYDLKETSKTSESVPKLEENNTSDESIIKDVKPALNSELNTDEDNFSVSRNNENISGFGEPSVSLGVGIANQKNSEDPFDDFDLTIGDFGSSHTDSGFVGDDEYDELEEFARNQSFLENSEIKGIEAEKQQEDSNIRNKNFSISNVKSEIRNTNNSYVSENLGSSNMKEEVRNQKVVLVTGLKGSGCTAYVVNRAMAEVKSGKKVLIVDLDYNDNGLLSFIDVKAYYDRNCINGINNLSVYNEDGIDIMSNGYNVGVQYVDSNFFKGSLDIYDTILLDCPIECINVLSDDVVKNSDIVICSISDVSKIIEFTNMLYNRNYVSSKKEKYISNKGVCANKKISSDDIKYVKDILLFPNDCWLNN